VTHVAVVLMAFLKHFISDVLVAFNILNDHTVILADCNSSWLLLVRVWCKPVECDGFLLGFEPSMSAYHCWRCCILPSVWHHFFVESRQLCYYFKRC